MSNELDELEVRFYYDGHPTEVTFWRGPVSNCYEATLSSLRRCLKKANIGPRWGMGVVIHDDSLAVHFREYPGYVG